MPKRAEGLFRGRLQSLLWYAAYLFVYLFVYREALFSSSTYTAYDLSVPPPNPMPTPNSVDTYVLSAWAPSYLGYLHLNFNLAWPFLSGLLMLLSFNDPVVAEKLLGLHTLLSFFTMDFLIKNHFTRSRPARFAGSFIYSLNPLAIKLSYSWWGYAFLPLAVNCAFNIVIARNYRVRNAVIFGLLTALAVSTYYYYLSIIPVIVLVSLAVSAISDADWRHVLKCAGLMFVSLAVFAILMFPYIWQNFLRFYVVGAPPPASTFVSWYGSWTVLGTFLMTFDIGGLLKSPSLLTGSLLRLVALCVFSVLVYVPLLLMGGLLDRRKRLLVLSSALSISFMVLFGLTATSQNAIFFIMHRYLGVFVSPLVSPPGAMLLVAFSYASLFSLSTELLLRLAGRVRLTVRNRCLTMPRWKSLGPPALVAILLVPYLIGNPVVYHDPLTYPNPPSFDQMYSFLHQKGDDGSFRYMIVPWDVQTGLNAEKFPHALAPGGGLRDSANYVRFVNNMFASNATEHLGALLSPANVRYVIVDKIQQRWFPSSRVAYDARYGTLRTGPSGIYGDWRKFSNILDRQRDLKLVANETGFMVYENVAFADHVELYSNMTLVVGDRRSLAALVDKLGVSLESAVAFADQDPAQLASLLSLTSSVVFYDRNFEDLLMETLVDDYGLGAYNVTYQKSEIVIDNPSGHLQLYYPHYGFTHHNRYISMSDGSSLEVTRNISSDDDYEVYVRPFFSHDAGELTLSGVGTSYHLKPESAADLGFKWHKIASLHLSSGKHRLTLSSNGGRNDIDELVIVPAGVRNDARTRLSRVLEGKEILFLWDSTQPLGRQSANDTAISLPFFATKGEHVLMFKLQTGVDHLPVSVRLGSNNVQTAFMGENWYSANLTLPESGEQTLSLVLPSQVTPNIIALSTSHVLDSLRSGARPKLDYTVMTVHESVSQLKYVVTAHAKGPAFVTLSEAFDPAWSASSNGSQLAHFTSFSFSNMFYLPSAGEGVTVEISFSLQEVRNIMVVIVTLSLIVACVYTAAPSARRVARSTNKRFREHSRDIRSILRVATILKERRRLLGCRAQHILSRAKNNCPLGSCVANRKM
jgi:hypothetical protein